MAPAVAAAIGMAASNIITNSINSAADREAKDEAVRRLSAQQSQSNTDYSAIINQIQDYYANRGSLGSQGDVDTYKRLVAEYDPDSYVYNRGQFGDTYNKGVEDFLNPLKDKIIADEVAKVQHSAAGAGLGRGSGAAQSIAQAVADKNEQLYKDAQDMYRDDRDFAYRTYSDYADAMQKALDTKREAMGTKIQMYGNLANDYYNYKDAEQSDLLKARQDKIGTNATYATAMAGIY